MEFDYNIPIYLQVARSIKARVAAGSLQPGDKLPSNLDLAVSYQINPNTVQRIYRELESEGVTFTRRGIGTFISEDESVVQRIRKEMSLELVGRFQKEMEALGFSPEEIVEAVRAVQTNRSGNEPKGRS